MSKNDYPRQHVNALQLIGRTVKAKAILFDKDGTLVEFHELWIGTTQNRVEEVSRQLEKQGQPKLDPDERQNLSALLGVPGGHLGIECGRVDPYGPLIMSGPADHETLAAGFIYQRRGGRFNDILSFTREAFQTALNQQCPRLLLGADQVLRELQSSGWIVGIVTNDGEQQTESVLSQLGVKHLFNAVICAHEQTVAGITKRVRKPDPEMVFKFCREVRVLPGETVIVADSHNDLNMGPAAGCAATIGVRSGVDPDELLRRASPDVILDSVMDLSPMILKTI